MPDMLSMHFRYANMLAHSTPNTPERTALSDIVRWISDGRNDYDNLETARENALKRVTVAQFYGNDTPDPELGDYLARVTAVLQEFLDYTSSL